MPPLPRIRTEALADLARQLRFTPRETVRRQLDRALELAGEVDGAVEYPPDWIVFRVTGHRAELGAAVPVRGRALLADLSAFCERLSHAAGLTAAELDQPHGAALGVDELRARWGVSRKSLERYRRAGLIGLRVRGDNGRSRLVFPAASLGRFEARHAAELSRAKSFTRMPREVESRIIRRAAAYRRKLGCTLNQAAIRLSKRFGRGLETVRQLLRRHDAASAVPVFTEAPPPTPRQRRVAYRAWRLGIDPGEVARRYGHRRPAVRRVITDERAARLRALVLGPPETPGRVHAGETEPVQDPQSGWGVPGATDLFGLIASARGGPAPDRGEERRHAAEYHRWVARAAGLIRSLPEHGASARSVDEAETALRHAARLKAELVRSQLPLAIRTLEAALGRSLAEVRSGVLGPLVSAAIGAVAEAIDAFDPSRSPRGGGGRLAAPAGLAVTRVASRFAKEHPAEAGDAGGRGRATPRLRAGVPHPDWTLSVAPWQRFLEPDPRVRARLGALDAPARELLEARFGWGPRPHTLAELAAQRRTTVIKIAMRERAAIHAAIRAASPPARAG